MRFKAFFLFVACLIFSAANSFGEEAPLSGQPKIVVPEPTYKFEQVLEGAEVLHDFVIQNKGTAQLIIKKVKPG
jgi:hypothetical protein